jgi:hypothetical protein
VQHALRAFTPRDQKAVQSAAQTFRQNPILDVAETITQLAVGEALVSLLDATGTPGIVERAFVLPPHSQIGPIGDEDRKAIIAASVVAGVYDTAVDRESAAEILQHRAQERIANAPAQAAAAPAGAKPAPLSPGAGAAVAGAAGVAGGFLKDLIFGSTGPRGGKNQGLAEKMASSAVRSVGSTMGREIMRGLLGSFFGSRRR